MHRDRPAGDQRIGRRRGRGPDLKPAAGRIRNCRGFVYQNGDSWCGDDTLTSGRPSQSRRSFGILAISPRECDVKGSKTVNVPCRRCARGPVQCILPSERGAYLRCDACGHLWQEDGLVLARRGRRDRCPGRRRDDRFTGRVRGSPSEVGAADRCPHCGRISDDEAQRLMQRLAERIAQLEEDNRLLRESARGFGELAERLSERVRDERDERR